MDSLYRLRHTFCAGGYHWWHTEPQRWYWILGVALVITIWLEYLKAKDPNNLHILAYWFQDTPPIVYIVTGVIGALAGLIFAIHWGSHIIFWMLVGFGIGYTVLPLSIMSVYFGVVLTATVGFIFFLYWMVC